MDHFKKSGELEFEFIVVCCFVGSETFEILILLFLLFFLLFFLLLLFLLLLLFFFLLLDRISPCTDRSGEQITLPVASFL